MKVNAGISRRHVHLNEETCIKLFGSSEMPVRNPLNQPGQYASTLVVDLKWNDKVIEHVRVCGPIRNYNQVEISKDEALIFEVNPPVRKSGDISGSLPITIIGPCGEVTITEGLIMAERHVHMTPESAAEYDFDDEEEVMILKDGKEVFTARIKVEDPSFDELHIDTFEESEYNIHQGEEVEVIKCGR